MEARNNAARSGRATRAQRNGRAGGGWAFARLAAFAALLTASLSCGGPAKPSRGAVASSGGVNSARPAIGCVEAAPERCFNALDDNCNGIVDEGCGVQGGLIQFSVAWEDPQADVDLDVQGPNGRLAEVGRVTPAGLTKERDCPGRDNECEGRNTEIVFLDNDGELTRGVYTISVRLARAGESEEPVRVNFSARLGPKTFSEELEFAEEQDERRLELKL